MQYEKPISIIILKSWWRLFGHILRQDIANPANKVMEAYFFLEVINYIIS